MFLSIEDPREGDSEEQAGGKEDEQDDGDLRIPDDTRAQCMDHARLSILHAKEVWDRTNSCRCCHQSRCTCWEKPIRFVFPNHYAMYAKRSSSQNVIPKKEKKNKKRLVSYRITHASLRRLHRRLMCHRLSFRLLMIIVKDLLLGPDHIRQLALLPPEATFLPPGLVMPFLAAAAPFSYSFCNPSKLLSIPRVIPSLVAIIGNPEPLIHPHHHITQHHNDLDPEIEDVEARLALIPRRIRARPRASRIVDPHAEGRAQAEQCRGDEEDADLMPPPARSEFLWPLRQAGEDEDGDQHDGDGEEGDDGVHSLAVQGDGAIDVFGVRVEGIEGLDDGDDEHDQRHHNEDVYPDERPMRDFMPPQVRMARAEDSLCEDDVDDEHQHHPRSHKDLRGDGHAHVERVAGPHDAHDLCDDPRHAEAEEHAGHDEFVAPAPVGLEDEHV